ncbi:MAG: phosphate/phosphite/phosphonate ABC transporter substrate-binding protein [Desulfobacterales bacterium]|jgi:phosphonate transport system substrate-binding protein
MRAKRLTKGRIILAMTGLAFMLTLLCTHEGQAQTPNTMLKLAIIPHRSSLGNEHAYGKLIEALEQETGFSFKWTGSKTYDDVIKKVGTRQADIGFVGAFAYVDARERYGVKLIARTYGQNRRESYFSMIITRAEADIHSLEDLKGKSFVFNDPKSTSGFLFPMVALRKAGINSSDFAEVRHVTRHANSLLAVYNQHVDAGAISSTAQEKVDIDIKQIKVLWQSAPIYRGPWIASKDLPDEQFERIQKALLKISRYPDAEKIFRDLGTKGFIKGTDRDYDNIREVRSLMHQLTPPN